MLQIASDSKEAFNGRLLEHERILWAGRPAGGIFLTARDGLLIPFSLLWCGFAIFWTYQVIAVSAPWYFLLWGSVFVLIGLYFVFIRFLVDAWVRSRTRYAVTDSRILILRSGVSQRFSALHLRNLPEIGLSERQDGLGTIRFGPPTPWMGPRRLPWAMWTPALDEVPQFLLIDNGREVFDLIQRSARTTS